MRPLSHRTSRNARAVTLPLLAAVCLTAARRDAHQPPSDALPSPKQVAVVARDLKFDAGSGAVYGQDPSGTPVRLDPANPSPGYSRTIQGRIIARLMSLDGRKAPGFYLAAGDTLYLMLRESRGKSRATYVSAHELIPARWLSCRRVPRSTVDVSRTRPVNTPPANAAKAATTTASTSSVPSTPTSAPKPTPPPTGSGSPVTSQLVRQAAYTEICPCHPNGDCCLVSDTSFVNKSL